MTRNNRERADADRNNYLFSHDTQGKTIEQELDEMVKEAKPKKQKPFAFGFKPRPKHKPKRNWDDTIYPRKDEAE